MKPNVLLLAAALAAVAQSGCCADVRRRAVNTSEVTFTEYMTYSQAVAYLRGLQQRFPKLVTLGSVGRSVEGRDLVYARVSSAGANNNNPVMLVDALMHAREWITLPPVLYFLEQLVQDAALLAGLDVVVVPILNPDGYEYSRTTDRLWRKNRGSTPNKTCTGVDLNRNFDYHWADFKPNNDGASSDPCDLLYAGPSAASEPETKSYQSFVRNLNAAKRVKMYVNLHNPEKSIYVPWGYSVAAKVPDVSQLTTIADKANSALVKAGATAYHVESMAADYPATGTVSDWVRGVAGVAQSFCMELPAGGRDALEGFDVPTTRILPISREVFEALKVFAKYAKKPLTQ